MSSIKQLWDLIATSGDGRYTPARVREQLVVVDTVSDSSGATTQARGTIDGNGDFSVDVRGKGIRTGMTIGVTRPLDDPTAPLAFDGIDGSDDPTAGYTDTDPNLPAPAFDAPPYTTTIVAAPGSVTGRITVNFIAVPDKYSASQYLVSYRSPSVTGPWADVIVPALGGSQVCALPGSFPPGAAVDLKLRARYAWAHADSVPSAVVTATVAADTGSPGVASTVSVSNATPGQLIATVTSSTVDPNLFAAWRYEFSTAATGPATATIQSSGQAVYTGTPGNYWVRAAPVSKSGTVGTYTGWTGPTTLTTPTSLDTTPPAAWTAAPIVADASYIDAQNVWHGQVRITLPAGHTFEPDYAYTLVRVRNQTTGAFGWYQLATTALGPLMVEATDGSVGGAQTILVDVVGVDLSGNRLGTYSPVATVVVTVPGLPFGTLTAVVTQKALALVVSWSGVSNATFYEVWRAATPDGAGATRIATLVQGGWFLDPLTDQNIILPTYYYQARSFNAQGAGPVSQTPWPGAATLPADGQNLRLNSVTASIIVGDQAMFNKIVAGKVLTSMLATAAAGARWELEGATGSANQAELRWFDAAGWVRLKLNPTGLAVFSAGNWTKALLYDTGIYLYQDGNNLIRASFAGDGVRIYRDDGSGTAMLLNGSGLTFNRPDGNWALRTGQAGGVGYLESAGGFQIRGDYTKLDLTQAQNMVWTFTQPDTAGNFTGAIYLTRVHSSPGATDGFGLLGYHSTPGGVVPYRLIFGYSQDPLNASNNMPTVYTEISPGSLVATSAVITQSIYLGPSTNHLLTYNATTGTFDHDAGVRQANADGSAWKLQHQGVGGNLLYENSHGSMYYGWFANPGGGHNFGAGGAVYGAVNYGTLNHLSSAALKEDIGDAPDDLGARLARVVPRAFYRKGHGRKRREIGFIAEEMAEALPEAVVEIAGGPADEDDPDARLPETLAIDPMVLIATLWQRVTDQDARLAQLEGAR